MSAFLLCNGVFSLGIRFTADIDYRLRLDQID